MSIVAQKSVLMANPQQSAPHADALPSTVNQSRYAVTLDAQPPIEVAVIEFADGNFVAQIQGHNVAVDGLGINASGRAPAAIREFARRAVRVVMDTKWRDSQLRRGRHSDPYAWTSHADALGYGDTPTWI